MNTFSVTKTNLGAFRVYKLYAPDAGAIIFTVDQTEEVRATPTRISMVTNGARSYGALNEEPVIQIVGDFNVDLSNKLPGITYKITALEPHTEYHCISRADYSQFNYLRVTADIGETVILQAGQNLFVGGGSVGGIKGPSVVQVSDESRQFIVDAKMFGLIFW